MPRVGTGFFVAAAWLAAALSTVAVAQAPTEKMPAHSVMTEDGAVLFTSTGMALYSYASENSGAEKFTWKCTNTPIPPFTDGESGLGERPQLGHQHQKTCLQKFPPYVADASARPVGDFSIVTRPEGTRQWAYRGLPLYTSVMDRKPGERNGIGTGVFRSGRMGYAMVPMELLPGLKFARREAGLAIVNAITGRPFYTRRGNRMRLASTGNEDFRPFLAPAAMNAWGDWSIVDAGAGRKQYAFRGQPLYEAPEGYKSFEIEDLAKSGGWDMVVVHKASPRPAEIGKQFTLVGNVYTDKAGKSLYFYNCVAGAYQTRVSGEATPVPCDGAGDPAVYMVALCGDAKECANRWRPYRAAANARPVGDWSIVEVTYPMFTDPRGTLYPADAPPVKVWAYRGAPLYTYYEDEKPGDIWGDGTKGPWGSRFAVAHPPAPAEGCSDFELQHTGHCGE